MATLNITVIVVTRVITRAIVPTIKVAIATQPAYVVGVQTIHFILRVQPTAITHW